VPIAPHVRIGIDPVLKTQCFNSFKKFLTMDKVKKLSSPNRSLLLKAILISLHSEGMLRLFHLKVSHCIVYDLMKCLGHAHSRRKKILLLPVN
jgi:hypothetical protein